MKASKGFTLIEVLVASAILALMALISWRGLDGMFKAQSQLQARSDASQTLQVGLAQWRTDLDNLTTLQNTPALDWDGRVLRITRLHSQLWAMASGRAGNLRRSHKAMPGHKLGHRPKFGASQLAISRPIQTKKFWFTLCAIGKFITTEMAHGATPCRVLLWALPTTVQRLTTPVAMHSTCLKACDWCSI